MIRLVKKPYFTLLELLIVMFVISFGVILTGVKVKDLYQEQRFLSETEQVKSYLTLAQDLMLIMNTDVYVNIKKNPTKDRLELWIEIEKPFIKAWERLAHRKLKLKAVKSFEWDGKKENIGKDFTLLFSLGQMSQGTFILYETDKGNNQTNGRQYAIQLKGYPSPFTGKLKDSKEDDKIYEDMARAPSKTVNSQSLYPAEVYEILQKKYSSS